MSETMRVEKDWTVRVLLRIAAIGAVALVLSGCGILEFFGFGSQAYISVDLASTADLPQPLLSRAAAPPGVEGLYFGELEVVAYDYRPGETVQTDQGGFRFDQDAQADWSYYVILQSGHDAARDNLLTDGAPINIDELNGTFGPSTPIAASFWNAVEAFEIDFLEVFMSGTGIVIGGEYMGKNADLNGLSVHPLHKYPALNGIPDYYTDTRFTGFTDNGHDINIMFANPALFSETTLIEASNGRWVDGVYDDSIQIDWSSRALSASQHDMIVSLIDQGTQRRSYSQLVIIPMPEAASITENETLQIDVMFDLETVIDPATDYDAIRAAAPGHPEVLMYSGDTDFKPFGLQVLLYNPVI